MDRADLRRALLADFDSVISRTWLVSAETRHRAKAARRCAQERDDWLDTLLEYVNKTYGGEEDATGDNPEDFESQKGQYPALAARAEEIQQSLHDVGYGFSPLLILAILGVLISLYQACKLSPAQARKRAARPRLLDLRVLRREIRREFRERDVPLTAEDEEVVAASVLDVTSV